MLSKLITAVIFASTLIGGLSAPAQSTPHRIDFRNFTYPGIWEKGTFRLKNGELEVPSEHCIASYSYDDARYVDLTGDGMNEALVTVTDHTACGSSSLMQYYYIYTFRSGRPRLLWKFSTGSESGGGLMNFQLRGQTLVFEVFGNYRILNSKVDVVAYPNVITDVKAEQYTRLFVEWNGRRFVTTNREVFPFPYKLIDEYEGQNSWSPVN